MEQKHIFQLQEILAQLRHGKIDNKQYLETKKAILQEEQAIKEKQYKEAFASYDSIRLQIQKVNAELAEIEKAGNA